MSDSMSGMFSEAQALAFAREWIDCWNAHDLSRILEHYTDDFSMTSPRIVEFAGEASGRLRGKAAVGAYWTKALGRISNLHFELIDVLRSPGGLVIYYRNQSGVSVAECLSFEASGKVLQAAAHYSTGSLT